MRLILIGPPGSGKGTQAQLLSQRLGLLHLATGDILREAVDKESPEGIIAKSYICRGQLVPDSIVNEIVHSRFHGAEKPKKFVLDGYPRTLGQAIVFDSVLKEQGLGLNAVIFLAVDDEEIVCRNSARWTCINPECMATYNTVSLPPRVTGRCDLCEHLLYQRADDKPETIRKRLQVFHERHDEIIRHYERQRLLVVVPGRGDIEAIHAAIIQSMKSKIPA